MAYRFKLKESLSRGVRRVGSEQFELAEGHLRNAADPVGSIHETRKCLKRAARIAAARPGGHRRKALSAREPASCSRCGHLLSPARDAEVMRQTLAKLETRLSGNRRIIVDRLREHLDQTAPRETGEIRGKVLSLLGRAKRPVRANQGPERTGSTSWKPVCMRTYRKGRRALVAGTDGTGRRGVPRSAQVRAAALAPDAARLARLAGMCRCACIGSPRHCTNPGRGARPRGPCRVRRRAAQ